MKLFLVIPWILYGFSGKACSCLYEGRLDDKQYDYYAFIATGFVDSIVTDSRIKTIYFRVETNYKGTAQQNTVLIETSVDSGMCGLNMAVNQKWLLYAHAEDGKYYTDMCTRSVQLERREYANWRYKHVVRKTIRRDFKYLERKLKTYRKYTVS